MFQYFPWDWNIPLWNVHSLKSFFVTSTEVPAVPKRGDFVLPFPYSACQTCSELPWVSNLAQSSPGIVGLAFSCCCSEWDWLSSGCDKGRNHWGSCSSLATPWSREHLWVFLQRCCFILGSVLGCRHLPNFWGTLDCCGLHTWRRKTRSSKKPEVS